MLLSAFVTIVSSSIVTLLPNQNKIIVDICSDFETCNLQFHATWRRLGRGVRVAGYSDKLVVAFVSASDPKEAPEVAESDYLLFWLC